MKQFTKSLLFLLVSLLLPATTWAADPDLENDYTLVKEAVFGGSDAVAIACSGACAYTAYDTGNKKQQSLTIATAPEDAAGWIAFQGWTDGSGKGWWNRAGQSLYCVNAQRSAAVFGDDLTTGWLVVFECKGNATSGLTLTNADGNPDGTFTYTTSEDGKKYFCTITAESNAYIGFCGIKNSQGILKISVYKPNKAVVATTYSVNYVDTEGNTLKESSTYDAVAGADVSIAGADKANITVGEDTYVYDSDNSEGVTVAEDGSTVVTVVFHKAQNFAYKVNEVCGGTIVRTTEGTSYETATVKVPFRFYNAVDGKLYKKSQINKEFNYSFTLSQADQVETLEYAAVEGVEDVVFISEGEDIEGLTVITSGNTGIRSSNSSSAFAAEDTKIVKLSAGTYKMHAIIYDSSSKPDSHWIFMAGSTQIADFNCTTVNIQEFDSEEFTLTEDTEIIMTAAGASARGLDALYITGTGKVVEDTDEPAEEAEIFSLAGDMFYTWDGFGADASKISAATVEFNVGNALQEGNVVAGTGNVAYLTYADLTGCTKMLFEGTPGLTLRVLMNRQESNNGPLVEKKSTIGEDSKAELDLTDLPYVHVNAIKVDWGNSGTVTAIKLVKPNDPLAVNKEGLKNAIAAAKLQNAVAKTEESYAALQAAIAAAEAAVAAADATAESLDAAKKAVEDAVAGLALAEGYENLTKEMFLQYASVEEPGEGTNGNGAYQLFAASDLPYGDSNVSELKWADLTAYDQLIITTTGEVKPRLCLNRLVAGGQQAATMEDSKMLDINPNNDFTWSTEKYLTAENGVYTLDVKAIVADYQFARLHCIKKQGWGAGVVVTGLYLKKAEATPEPAAATTWNFAEAMSDADVANLTADAENWKDSNGDQTRFENVNALQNTQLTANGQELEWTKGIEFVNFGAGKLRLNPGKNLQLNGKGLSIKVPAKAGQKLTVVAQTAKNTEARYFTAENLEVKEGFAESLEKIANVGIVKEDGFVTLKTNVGGMNISSITVEEAGDEPVDSELMAEAKALAADADAVAVGKLLAAIETAQSTGDESGLQAAIDQFKKDNEPMKAVGANLTDKVGLTTAAWTGAGGTAGSVTTSLNATTPLVELYNSSSAGTKMQQTISGLENGTYRVKVFATSHNARGEDGAALDGTSNEVAYVFAQAGETINKTWITASGVTPGFLDGEQTNPYTIDDIDVTNGELTIGLTVEQAGQTGWHTIQIYSLEKIELTPAKEIYAKDQEELKKVIAELTALLALDRMAEQREIWQPLVDEIEKNMVGSNMHNISEIEAVIGNLKAMIRDAKRLNPIVPTGSYYVLNAAMEPEMLMAAGNNWGTRGIVSEKGIDLNFTYDVDKDAYTIETGIYNNANSHFLGSGLYMDSGTFDWTIEGDFVYTISAVIDGVKKYIGVDEAGNLALKESASDDCQWAFLKKDYWENHLMEQGLAALEAATPENGVDATFLLKDANFNRNDHRWEAWTVSEDCTNKNLGGGCDGSNGNGNAESYHSTFTISQAIANAPKGTYTLTAQGFYRQDDGLEEAVPVFFMNDATAEVPVKTGDENSMTAASYSFSDGKYTIEPITVTINKGETLTVGVKGTATNQWVIFDNFRLTYYGANESDLLKEAKALAADAEAVAVGKLLAAIDEAENTGDESNLQAAIDQFKADNADVEKDMTSKVATNGWKKYDGTAAGVCATQYAPAITTYDGREAQLAEVYEGTVETTGTIIYQDITGLQNGSYKVGFYGNAFYTDGRGFDSPMADGAEDVAYVFANDEKEFITAHIATSTTENNFRSFNVDVTNGAIKLGMGKAQPGTNWHTMQIYQLTWFTTAKSVYAQDQEELKALVAEAKALLANDNNTEGRDIFQPFVEGVEKTYIGSNMYNISEIEAVIGNLKDVMKSFKKANQFIYDGVAYVIDAESGKFMAAGHDWGTRGIVSKEGLDLTFASNEETRTVTIDTKVSNGGESHFLGSNLYMDAAAYGWALEYRGFGFYISNGTQYINIDENDNLVLSDQPREWIIVTADGVKQQRMEEMATATKENPVDVTWMLQNPNFNRNDQRTSAWTVSEDCTNKTIGGPNNNNVGGNYISESYHSTFTIQQVIADAPKGTYMLTAQGFYRQDGDATEDAPVFFLNDATTTVPVKTGDEGSMDAAAASFTAGQYTSEPIELTLTADGELAVGVKGTALNQWVTFDNFRLTYLGTGDMPETDELVQVPAGAEQEDWNIVGNYVGRTNQNMTVKRNIKVAFVGNDVYVQGTAYFFPEAWLKGTIDGTTATFATGQLVGEDEYGKEYMVGSSDGKTIENIVFTYDAEAKQFELKNLLIENSVKEEIDQWGYYNQMTISKGLLPTYATVEAPEGLQTEQWTFLAQDRYSEDVEAPVNVGIDGNDMYIQGLCEYFPEAWVKGTIDGTKVTFAPGQYFGSIDGDDFFFGAYDFEGSGKIIAATFDYDAAAGKLATEDYLVLNGEEEKTWMYNYFWYVEILKDVPALAEIEAPENLQASDYVFLADELSIEEGEEETGIRSAKVRNAIAKAAGDVIVTPIQQAVRIAFNGNDVYFQGLAAATPEKWNKGTLSEDGKTITIPANQFIGTAYDIDWSSFQLVEYKYFFTAVDAEGKFADAVLSYDEATKTISSNQQLVVNSSRRLLNYWNYYNTGSQFVAAEVATPAMPAIVEMTENTYGPMMVADIPVEDIYGDKIYEPYLSYRVYSDVRGVQDPYVFDAETYEEFEDMPTIPYQYDDGGFYFTYAGKGTNILAANYNEWKRIGLSSVYTVNGKVRESKVFWFDIEAGVPVGIDGITANDKTAVFYDMQGRKVNGSAKGLLIKQQRDADGNTKAVKVIRK